MTEDDEDKVTVVTAEDFEKNPELYLNQSNIRIIFPDSPLTITVMPLVEPRRRGNHE